MIAVDSAANSAASFRREWPRSVKRQHDAGAHNANADLDGAIDGEDQDDAVRAPDRPQDVDRKDRRGVAGQRRGVGGEIAQ